MDRVRVKGKAQAVPISTGPLAPRDQIPAELAEELVVWEGFSASLCGAGVGTMRQADGSVARPQTSLHSLIHFGNILPVKRHHFQFSGCFNLDFEDFSRTEIISPATVPAVSEF